MDCIKLCLLTWNSLRNWGFMYAVNNQMQWIKLKFLCGMQDAPINCLFHRFTTLWRLVKLYHWFFPILLVKSKLRRFRCRSLGRCQWRVGSFPPRPLLVPWTEWNVSRVCEQQGWYKLRPETCTAFCGHRPHRPVGAHYQDPKWKRKEEKIKTNNAFKVAIQFEL